MGGTFSALPLIPPPPCKSLYRIQSPLMMAHTDITKTPVAKPNRRKSQNLCVLFVLCAGASDRESCRRLLHLHFVLTNRVNRLWRPNGLRGSKNSQCVLLLLLLFFVLDVVSLSPPPLPPSPQGCVRSCVCMLPSCWFVSHSPFFCFSVCPFLFVFLFPPFCFCLCVTVRPFLCGSVSCV